MADILVADDDTQITQLLTDSLINEGFTVDVAYDGSSTYDLVLKNEYKLILLDIMMPKMDGLEICRKMRENISCPIIFVTAKNKPTDTIVGLELGADDYIKKPFELEELIAKVKAHIRREERRIKGHLEKGIYTYGDITLCRDSFEVTKAGKQIELSTREFILLAYMMENAGKVLNREQIFDDVWGADYTDIGSVTVTIKNLRKKIDEKNKIIRTVWGVGYMLVKPQRGGHD